MLRLFKKALSSNARVGVMRDGGRVELAVVRRNADGSMQLAAQNIDFDGNSWADIDHDAPQDASVSAVLGSDAYSLQLIEAPNVPDAEKADAVRWRIQNLIEFPIDEAVIEIFEMPAPANPGNSPMIYAVVAHRDELATQIEQIQSAHLRMDVIDIPELCARNVAVQLPQDAAGVAFLHFTDDCGYLTITRKGVLYMVRRIETRRGELTDVPADELSLQDRAAGVALEVQRSLDYYESHYDCQPITSLVLGPGSNLDSLAATLTESLGIAVSRLNLDELFSFESDIDTDVQSDCLLAIGAALRSDDTNVAANGS